VHTALSHRVRGRDVRALYAAAVPILFIHGRHDIVAAPALAARLAARMRAPLMLLDGAHFVTRECAGEVNALLLAQLAGLLRPAAHAHGGALDSPPAAAAAYVPAAKPKAQAAAPPPPLVKAQRVVPAPAAAAVAVAAKAAAPALLPAAKAAAPAAPPTAPAAAAAAAKAAAPALLPAAKAAAPAAPPTAPAAAAAAAKAAAPALLPAVKAAAAAASPTAPAAAAAPLAAPMAALVAAALSHPLDLTAPEAQDVTPVLHLSGGGGGGGGGGGARVAPAEFDVSISQQPPPARSAYKVIGLGSALLQPNSTSSSAATGGWRS